MFSLRSLCTSIVIVNYNGGQILLDCVASVQKFTRDYELLVVDNGSSDGSADKLGQLFSGIRIIRNHSNLGFAKGNNIGIRESKGKYIVLMNSDVVVDSGWLDTLIYCMERDPRIGIATPKLLRTNGKLDSTGHLFRFIELEGKNRGEEEQDHGQYDSLTELLSCDFACPIIRKEVIEHIGDLDETFFFYHEDIDFCLRAKIAGWRVIFCPSSKVFHNRGGSTPPNQRASLGIRRQRYLLRLALKSYSSKNIGRVLLHKQKQLLLLLRGVFAGLKNADQPYIKLRVEGIGTLLAALLWNALHLPIKERIVIQRLRRIDDNDLQLMSKLTMKAAFS